MKTLLQYVQERCWKGYGPVKGKRPYSKGSCKRVNEAIDKSGMKCNTPRAQSHGNKSHVVKACFDGKEKIIRFGQRGVKGSPKKEGESESYRNRRERFRKRHRKNIKKGRSSAAYWANKVKW